ncbi:hypothetical protein [Mucilaginibacter sp.]|jgi:hypothetical protein|uniref:hypothetical protein n=1 Tax=Mucilaginibacter sp. TaxID=1882438 RepID=UPI0035640B0C
MTRFKSLLGLLCTYAAYYTVVNLCDQRTEKPSAAKPPDEKAVNDQTFETEPFKQQASKSRTVLVHNTVARSIYAYDNSNHNTMVHVRFDAQTVDLLNKFKMATGTDITKLVAFAVKYLFETNPELKTIIKQFIKNTEL